MDDDPIKTVVYKGEQITKEFCESLHCLTSVNDAARARIAKKMAWQEMGGRKDIPPGRCGSLYSASCRKSRQPDRHNRSIALIFLRNRQCIAPGRRRSCYRPAGTGWEAVVVSGHRGKRYRVFGSADGFVPYRGRRPYLSPTKNAKCQNNP